jgi:hypothetical protein
VNGIAFCSLEIAPVHSVIRFQVSDDRFNGLASFKQSSFFVVQALVLASMLNADIWVLLIDTAVTKIDVHIFDGAIGQNAGLLELFGQRVANGMDAPTCTSQKCAKVEMSFTTHL